MPDDGPSVDEYIYGACALCVRVVNYQLYMSVHFHKIDCICEKKCIPINGWYPRLEEWHSDGGKQA